MTENAPENGYEGVTHAGIAVIAADTGRVLLAQREYDETDDESVRETWEFPGGSLNEGENPESAAFREFSEEIGVDLPEGEVIDGWRGGENSETGHYQGFVYQIAAEFPVKGLTTDEVQAVAWYSSDEVQNLENEGVMRPEIVATMDWSLVFPETQPNEETDMEDPTDYGMIAPEPMLVHGILAPEGVETGDKRGFLEGSMTTRPLRIPFRWQESDIGGHDGAITVGSVDRLMRKDGLIHWEGTLMTSAKADEFADLLAFFGRYGVSVDGDKGTLDLEHSKATGTAWFDTVRAAGLTAVAIPAFAEAYVAFGPNPHMPAQDSAEFDVLVSSGSIVGQQTFDRGPGWVTNPKETNRIHDYWTKKGQPGYAKIGWGTRGDFTRAKALIGEKIAKNSPEKMRYLNQIIAQWHHDALGYWPGDLDKPGNKTTAEARAERSSLAAALKTVDNDGITATDDGTWETVLVSSAGTRALPPIEYFHRQENSEALVVEEPDAQGFIRTYGYAGEWGVCHIGMSGRCVEPPITGSDDYPEFHLGRTKTEDGYIYTGVLTYGVGHRDAQTILRETPEQAYFDNINNAWAAVRVGEDERGIWFSGVVLPGVDPDHLVKIEASGQVSGEWLKGAMRACLTVNVPGFPVERASAEYDEFGNVVALAASAFNDTLTASINQTEGSPCAPTAAERMAALAAIDAEIRFTALKEGWNA